MEINIGDKFGNWTVLALSDKTDSSHNKYYTCQCVCVGQLEQLTKEN